MSLTKYFWGCDHSRERICQRFQCDMFNLNLGVNFGSEPMQLLLVYLVFAVIKQSGEALGIDQGVWRMTPNSQHQVVAPNSTVTIICSYAFESDSSGDRFKNLTWKWELPDYLAKFSKVISAVSKCLKRRRQIISTNFHSLLFMCHRKNLLSCVKVRMDI